MKRLGFALPVVLLAMAFVLPAVTASAATSGPVKITVFTWGFPAEKKAREDTATAFMKKFPNIQVDLQVSPDYDRKLDAMLASSAGPDVFETSDDWYHLRGKNGQLADLSSYVKKDNVNLSLFYPKMMKGFTLPNGMIESMPIGMDAFAMAINTDLFKKAGLKIPTNAWTWSEALADAQKLTAGTGVDKIFGMSDHWMYGQISAYLYGGSFMSADYKTVTAADPTTVKGVQFLVDLMFKYGVMPDPNAAKGLSSEQRFFSGKSGMMPVNNWDIDNFESNIGSKFNWIVVNMPVMDANKTATSWYITEGYGMWSKSPNKDAAWQFIKWATTDPEASKIAARAAVPALQASAKDFVSMGTPNKLDLSVFVNTIPFARLSPFGGIFGQIGDEFYRAWDLINTKRTDTAVAMKSFVDAAQPIVDQLPQ
jgi:multiple sugar transport system substrate-binding protein